MSVTPEELAALRQRVDQSESLMAELRIRSARLDAYERHPHLRPLGILEDFQGSPEQIGAFADKMAERIPAPAPTPAPLTAAPNPPTPAAPLPPVAQTQVAPPAQTAPSAAPAPPETTRLPTPASQDVLNQNSADAVRADEIREKMVNGLATRAEALWLSQWAPRREVDLGNGMRGMAGGFVAAVKQFNAERAAR